MSKATHWSQLSEAGTIVGMRLLLFIYRVLGRWAFYLVLWPVMVYFYCRNDTARNASAEFRAHISPSTAQAMRGHFVGLKHFISFGDAILDKFLAWMGQINREQVVFENADAIEALADASQGGVIIVSHLGNIEVCRALAYKMPGVKLTVLVHTRHAAKFNALMSKMAPQTPINLMQVTDMTPATAMQLADRVAAGEYIVIAGDRTPVEGGRVSRVDFLGQAADFPQGPIILAALLKCSVSLMFCLKQDKRYHIYLEPFAERVRLARGQREEQITQHLQMYAERLAAYAAKAPLQWFNFYPFWQPFRSTSKQQCSADSQQTGPTP